MMFCYLDNFGFAESYDIEPLNMGKRLRVYQGQLLEAINDNPAKWAKVWYEQTGKHLQKRFNLSQDELSF